MSLKELTESLIGASTLGNCNCGNKHTKHTQSNCC